MAAPPDEVVAPEPPQPEPVAVVAPEPPKPEPVTKVEVAKVEVAKVEVAKPVAARVAPPHPVVTPTPAPGVAARATGVGELLVTAQPWARASVNGRPYGTVPLKLTLPVGVHTVTLSKGDRSYTSSVTVHEGAVATVSRDFE
ncbi:MAG: PEGA domain-containing protein [Myxococcota bacterium]